MQKLSVKRDVFRAITSFEEAGQLQVGDKVYRPYKGVLTSNAVGTSGAYTRQDVTMTGELLTIDQKREVTFYVEDYNELQSKYPVGKSFADDASIALYNWIDGDVLGEYDCADSVIGNYQMTGSGSSGDLIGFILTTSNILSVFSKANRALDKLNVPMEDRWAVISPEFRDILFQFIAGKESALGDATGVNGHIGKYAGFKLYLSNATGWSARFELPTTVPTAADILTINGVTFTFVNTGDVDAAGEIYYGANVGATCDNIVASVNAPGTASAGIYYPVSAANQALLKGITAADGATYVTFKAEGRGTVAVSCSMSTGTNLWTLNKQLQHNLFGQGKPIDLVIQKYPNLGIFHRDGYIGKDFVTWTFYGLLTFDEGDRHLVDVQIRSDAF